MTQKIASEPVADMVKVRNVTRNSLNFRIPGQSIYLLPGQAVSVPRCDLDTHELEALCRQGAVILVTSGVHAAGAAKEDHMEPRSENTRQGDAVVETLPRASLAANKDDDKKPESKDTPQGSKG